MKVILFFLSSILSLSTFAQQCKTAFDQLVSVNEQWKYQPDIDPALKTLPAQLLNEQQLIQFHLQEVEKLLQKRKNNPIATSENRIANLSTLKAYAKQGNFPKNTMHQNRQPYFIDDFNTYCAVGYLMKEHGGDDIAKDIHTSQNYSYLYDIHHPQLMEWVNCSGLSLDELALIQPGYDGDWPTSIMEIHYNNIGTDVNEYIEIHESSSQTSGALAFEKAIFYNKQEIAYKTLLNTDMQSLPGGYIGYYYTFPSTDSFADIGKIILFGVPWSTGMNDTLQVINYTDTSIDVRDVYSSGPYTNIHFSVGENNNTAVGTSLSYCGQWGTSSWKIESRPSTIGIAQSCIIMPVEMGRFSAQAIDKKVRLQWETFSEKSNSYFDIQRSENGLDFLSVGKVKSAANSSTIQQYNFIDENPSYSNHYRLKQVYADGNFSYSKILFVKVQNRNALCIKGNLVKDILQVQVRVPDMNIESLVMYDFSGRKILDIKARTGEQSVSVAALIPGKYLLQLITKDGQAFNQIFVK